MVQPDCLEGKENPPSFSLSVLSAPFFTIPSVPRRRPILRRPILAPKAPAPAPVPVPNNDLFQEFMWTCIKKVSDQALVAPAAPAVPAIEAKDNADRLLKPRNPDLYYSQLHMECYYFCQQYKNHFKVVGSLGHKRVPFAAGFLKSCILNRWQQHKTRM